MEDCIFCKIIKGEIPSTKVYEDGNVLAFKDINPAAPIHILVVPKQHIENVLEINEENKEIASNIFLAINKIAKQLGISRSYVSRIEKKALEKLKIALESPAKSPE